MKLFYKNILVVCTILSNCALNFSNSGYVDHSQTIHNNISLPKETTKVMRPATPSEIALAEKSAARDLANLDKSSVRIFVENFGSALSDTMNLTKEYTWDTQPFGIQHGGKAIVFIAACALAYYIYCKNNEDSDCQPRYSHPGFADQPKTK